MPSGTMGSRSSSDDGCAHLGADRYIPELWYVLLVLGILLGIVVGAGLMR